MDFQLDGREDIIWDGRMDIKILNVGDRRHQDLLQVPHTVSPAGLEVPPTRAQSG